MKNFMYFSVGLGFLAWGACCLASFIQCQKLWDSVEEEGELEDNRKPIEF